MKMFRYTAITAAVGATLLLTACGSDPVQAPAPAPSASASAPAPGGTDAANPATVTWLDGYCASMAEVVPPSPQADTSTFAAFKKYVDSQLGGYITHFGRTLDGLKALPPGPVPSLETMRQGLITNLGNAHTLAMQTKAELDKVRKDDYDGVNKASTTGGKVLETAFPKGNEITAPLTKDLDIYQAYEAAPKCKGVPNGGIVVSG